MNSMNTLAPEELNKFKTINISQFSDVVKAKPFRSVKRQILKVLEKKEL